LSCAAFGATNYRHPAGLLQRQRRRGGRVPWRIEELEQRGVTVFANRREHGCVAATAIPKRARTKEKVTLSAAEGIASAFR